MGEVVPARTSLTLHPHPFPLRVYCVSYNLLFSSSAPNSSEERYDKHEEKEDADHSGMEPEATRELEKERVREEGRQQGGFEGGIGIEDAHIGHRKPIVASGMLIIQLSINNYSKEPA